MKVLVTGASGFLGSHVVRKAIQHGFEVRAFVRKSSSLKNLEGLPIEIFTGELKSQDDLTKALAGCEWLFHLAADYRFTSIQGNQLLQTNIEGTKAVLAAAKNSNTSRIVYTSSIATIGIPKDGTPGNENTTLTRQDLVGPYKLSKYLAEQEALKAAAAGCPVVIVNPSAPVGSHDIKPTPTGKFIVDFLNGKLFAYTNTGLNLVDAEDVAEGHILAAQKGKVGERYILGNKNLDFKTILEILSSITGLPAPKFCLPHGAILFMAYANHIFSKNLLKKEPGIPLEGVKLSRKKMFFNPEKAQKELGIPQTPVEEALKKAVQWYQENGYVRK
jgi:dihydroflavonol-4-reductase